MKIANITRQKPEDTFLARGMQEERKVESQEESKSVCQLTLHRKRESFEADQTDDEILDDAIYINCQGHDVQNHDRTASSLLTMIMLRTQVIEGMVRLSGWRLRQLDFRGPRAPACATLQAGPFNEGSEPS